MNFIVFFLLFQIAVCNTIHSDDFHTLFTFIHNDPCILEDVFQLQLPNYVYPYCNKEINSINTLENLDHSAFVHIERIVDDDCPFSHNTCSHYCHIYNSCNFGDRIIYYLDKDTKVSEVAEVLVKNTNLDGLTAIYSFINSKSHSDVILNKKYNYYGISHYHNIFNMNFLKTDTDLKKEITEIKDTNIIYNDYKYTLTMTGNCNFENLIYNNSNMLIYKNKIVDE